MHARRAAVAALLLSVSASAVWAEMAAPTAPPEAPKFDAQTEPVYVARSDIFEYKALPSYSEPAWVTAFVDAGKLPPVAERLPKEPLVYKTANMPDGPGVYGDVMRHVIGGRPEGWNFWAGQSYGWGGIDIGLVECLTRTGPLFTVNAADLQPLPSDDVLIGLHAPDDAAEGRDVAAEHAVEIHAPQLVRHALGRAHEIEEQPVVARVLAEFLEDELATWNEPGSPVCYAKY